MKNKSFTLIELLVVIVIIGVLAGVIIVTTTSSIFKANVAKLKVFEEGIANNLSANMVSRWKLDEVTGTNPYYTPDVWGNNTGAVYGTTLKAEGECISGQCMEFDGIDDYIKINKSTSLDFVKEVSISMWIKVMGIGVNSGSFPKIIYKTNQWQVHSSDTDETKLVWNLYFNDGAYCQAVRTSVLEHDKWVYVVATL